MGEKKHGQNEILTKRYKLFFKILELNNSMNEMKKSNSVCIRIEQMEERIYELENKNFEISKLKENKEKHEKLKKDYVIYRVPSKV